MKLSFIKMQGAGNDYVYVPYPGLTAILFHKRKQSLPRTGEEEWNRIEWASLAIKLSNRHYGIGSDGLVLILPSKVADLRMRIFNADGSEAEMCGNAARCIGRYAFVQGLVEGDRFTLETKGGIRTVMKKDMEIMVDMGPTLGNPHLVRIVDELTDEIVFNEGPRLERSVPGRTNVEFVVPTDEHHVRIRVWERGSGETLACGTGACATAMEMVRQGRCAYPVYIEMRGGTLTIDYREEHILMTGPAEEVFRGEIEL